MKLADIHKAFISGIYNLEGQAPPDTYIKAGDNLDSEQSLAVYRGSVFGNLCSALADIYPGFVRCVGEAFFQALALRYVKAHPSTSSSLDDYGDAFPRFVSVFEPLATLPYVEDLATLEWYWHKAFHAKDEAALKPIELSQVSEDKYENLVFHMPKSARIMKSAYPVRDIWQHSLEEEGVSYDATIDLGSGPQSLLIWRAEGYEVRVDHLSDLEYELLLAVNKKKTLGTILLSLQSKASIEEINQLLTRAVQQGWFAAFDVCE